jgi:hypothetical protein
MAKPSAEELAAWRRAWAPSSSPWNAILPYFDWITQKADIADLFGSMRDFVAAAASEPFLAARHVYPSTINMTIFETAQPVQYDERELHRRVVVSPRGPKAVRVRYYLAQKEKPVWRWARGIPDEPGKIKVRVQEYVTHAPEAALDWVGDPRGGIEFIRNCYISV